MPFFPLPPLLWSSSTCSCSSSITSIRYYSNSHDLSGDTAGNKNHNTMNKVMGKEEEEMIMTMMLGVEEDEGVNHEEKTETRKTVLVPRRPIIIMEEEVGEADFLAGGAFLSPASLSSSHGKDEAIDHHHQPPPLPPPSFHSSLDHVLEMRRRGEEKRGHLEEKEREFDEGMRRGKANGSSNNTTATTNPSTSATRDHPHLSHDSSLLSPSSSDPSASQSSSSSSPLYFHSTDPVSSFTASSLLSDSSPGSPPGKEEAPAPPQGNTKNGKNNKNTLYGKWSPQQYCFRHLMKALRAAYFNDRSTLFWARHRVLVEMYKYSPLEAYEEVEEEEVEEEIPFTADKEQKVENGERDETEKEVSSSSSSSSSSRSSSFPPLTSRVQLLVDIAHDVATFIETYMKLDISRIIRHNEKLMSLPVREAKRFREEYFLAEKQHDSWCKQHIKQMLQRRPPPPYPFG